MPGINSVCFMSLYIWTHTCCPLDDFSLSFFLLLVGCVCMLLCFHANNRAWGCDNVEVREPVDVCAGRGRLCRGSSRVSLLITCLVPREAERSPGIGVIDRTEPGSS